MKAPDLQNILVHKCTIINVGLRIHRILPPLSFPEIDNFLDSKGQNFRRLQGYRDHIWGLKWEDMLAERKIPDVEIIKRNDYVAKFRNWVQDVEEFGEFSVQKAKEKT